MHFTGKVGDNGHTILIKKWCGDKKIVFQDGLLISAEYRRMIDYNAITGFYFKHLYHLFF
jgi:hypothetical protein